MIHIELEQAEELAKKRENIITDLKFVIKA